MKVKSLFLSFAFLLGATGASAEDNVSVVRPLNIKAGQTQKVAVALENATAYTAFQMDIKLPDGLTMSNPKSLRTSDATYHNISFGEVDGVYRVVALSYKQENDGSVLAANANKNFIDGNSEIILYFDITAANNYVDNGNIEVNNVKFVTADEKVQTLADASSANGSILGDVNGNGNINTVDASYILMSLVGNKPANFVDKAADVNLNGNVNTVDATAILRLLVE